MKYDAIIIGTGQAGTPLASSLANKGLKTAIIEKDQLGGSCVNVGCTPTKAYVASARRAFVAKNSQDMGISVPGQVNVDLRKIKERKDHIVSESRQGLEKMLTSTDGITLIRGKASFLNNNTILVNGNRYTADKIFINVGARPRIPEGFDDVPFLTNETILELDEVPEHLVIVGGGYIGLEFGQMFRRFGSTVTILEKGGRLFRQEDEDISEIIENIITDSGITVNLDSECIEAEQEDTGIVVNYTCQSKIEKIKATHLLLAAGRIPNTDLINLQKTDVQLNDKGYIKVNDSLKTTVDHIWALGDCNGHGAFTHTSYNDFQIVQSHLFEDKKRYLSDRFTCYAAFIDPPLARVGMNATQILNEGIKAKVAEYPMSQVARAKEMGETTGKMKIFINSSDSKILGATFVGKGADEYIHTIIDLMYAGSSFDIIRDAVHIHPTVSELIPTMLESLEDIK